MDIRKILVVCATIAAGLAVESCVVYSAAHFDALEPGLTAQQLLERIGSPDMLIGEVTTAFGQHVTVWEYEKLASWTGGHAYYWVYMVDGTYRKHSERRDWRKEKEIVYRTDFSRPEER